MGTGEEVSAMSGVISAFTDAAGTLATDLTGAIASIVQL